MKPFPNTQRAPIARPSREQLTAILARNRKHLGLTRTELFTLERLMAATDHRSWSDIAGIPVCWIGSTELASKHAVERGSWRRVERQLEAKGFIWRKTPANNYRGVIRSRDGNIVDAFGIYFPFLDRLEEILAIDAERSKAEDLIKKLTAEARAWRGHWLRVIRSLPATAADIYCRALAVYQSHTRAKRAYGSFTADALRELRVFAEDQVGIISHELARREVAASEAKTDRAITERERERKSVRGPSPADRRNGDRCSPDSYTRAATRYLDRMTEDELEKLCSPEMQELLAIRRGHRPTVSDFWHAAASRAQAIGISDELWVKACREMGWNSATIALIVIDRNLAHPTAPIRSAAGVLHAMAQRQKAGLLNLPASLYALARRQNVGRTVDREAGAGWMDFSSQQTETTRPWRPQT